MSNGARGRGDPVEIVYVGLPRGKTEADGTIELRGPRGENVKVFFYPDGRIRFAWVDSGPTKLIEYFSGRGQQGAAKVVLALDQDRLDG